MIKEVDPERLGKLIGSMRESVRLLNEIKDMSEVEFKDDVHKLSSAKYNFIVAIEAAIDIASHLISKKGFRAPEDYADTFQVIGEVGALDMDFADELRNMAKFRNRLVHIYWGVDDQQLYDILKTRLDDFKKFLDSMANFLGWQNLRK